jgi:hypothetical protein
VKSALHELAAMIKEVVMTMFADAETAIPYFLGMLAGVLVPTCIALIGCQRGRYSWGLLACASVPIIFAIVLIGGALVDFLDLEDFTFILCLSLPFFCAGWWSLSRLKQNKRKGSSPNGA